MGCHRAAQAILAALLLAVAPPFPPGGDSGRGGRTLVLAQAKGPVRYYQAPPLDPQQLRNRIDVMKARFERQGKRLRPGGTATQPLLR